MRYGRTSIRVMVIVLASFAATASAQIHGLIRNSEPRERIVSEGAKREGRLPHRR